MLFEDLTTFPKPFSTWWKLPDVEEEAASLAAATAKWDLKTNEHCLTFTMSLLKLRHRFPSRNYPSVVDLVRQVQDRIGFESARDVSASRWIATRRLGSFLASVEAIVSKHFSAKKAQVSI